MDGLYIARGQESGATIPSGIKKPTSSLTKVGLLSLAVFLVRPQADFKSAHNYSVKIVNILTYVN